MATLLFESSVADVVRAKPCLVDIPEQFTVGEALEILLKNNVLSAPVSAPVSLEESALGEHAHTILEPPEGPGGLGGIGEVGEEPVPGRHFTGMVSILDIAIHLIKEESFRDPEWALRTPVAHIVGPSNTGLTLILTDPEASVYEAMEPLSLGVRRLLVPLTEGPLPGLRVLTQTDMVRFLLDHAPGLRPIPLCSVSELSVIQPDLITYPASTKMGDALKVIHTNASDTSALAVVDEQIGAVVGQLSLSDLRGCTATELLKLRNVPVLEFLASIGSKPRAGGPLSGQSEDAGVVVTDSLSKLGDDFRPSLPELVEVDDTIAGKGVVDLGANILSEEKADIEEGAENGASSGGARVSFMEGRGEVKYLEGVVEGVVENGSEDEMVSNLSTATEWGSVSADRSDETGESKPLGEFVEEQRKESGQSKKSTLSNVSNRSEAGSEGKEKAAKAIQVEMDSGAFDEEEEKPARETSAASPVMDMLGTAALASMAPTAVTCKPDSTLVSVMARALANHVHRVWVVDDEGRPVGVVALQDMIGACRLSPDAFEKEALGAGA